MRGDETVEIAFFGGSFTGIDRDLMTRLLDVAQSYVNAGRVQSIRLSTRPDYITNEILAILGRYSVRWIELGLQSMDDAVLRASRRGHTVQEALEACRAVKNAGFRLAGQMMIGLPASNGETERMTAIRLRDVGVDAVRIYPTVVFYDTPLCEMAQSGSYTPLPLREAVERSADVLEIFFAAHIPCIRLGLCATEELTSPDTVYAGPNHPALGELVMSECAYREVAALLEREGLIGCEVTLRVPARRVSTVIGQHRENINRLLREKNTRVIRVSGDEHANEITAVPIEPSHHYPHKEEDAYFVSEIT